jgi:hypothetical protein
MIATAFISALAFWFVAEYEFVNIVASASAESPDQKRTIVVESKIHKSLFRQFRTVESRIIMSNGTVGMVQYHWLGSPQTESSNPPDLQTLGNESIKWASDSETVTYHVTDIESATIWMNGDRKAKIRRRTNGE